MADETERWLTHYVQQVEADPVINVRGRGFSCAFGYHMGVLDLTIRMHRGRVEDLTVDPGPFGPPRDFVLRASPGTWLQMAQPSPAPSFQGVFAALTAHDLTIEGDMLPLFQHLTCFTRQFEVLRTTGVPPVVRRAALAASTVEGLPA